MYLSHLLKSDSFESVGLEELARFQANYSLTSGARYSGVPQKVLVVAPYVISSLHRPKSVILI